MAKWLRDDLPRLERAGARVVASIWARTVDDYGLAAKMLVNAPKCVVAVEVNLSCPNLDGGAHLFAHSPEATAEALRAAAICDRPLWAKLSPNTDRLVEVARAAQAAGADAVTLVNTVMGMAIDVETGRPALGAGGGGLSGRAPRAHRGVDCLSCLRWVINELRGKYRTHRAFRSRDRHRANGRVAPTSRA